MTDISINEKVFRFLEGGWKIQRHFKGSYGGGFSGQAIFEMEADIPLSYHYTEQGELTDAEGKRFDARQLYRYRLVDGRIEVLKQEDSDWSVMHQLDFSMEDGAATAAHVHLCGQDNYATVYQIDFSGSWEISYAVEGPRKDYCIRTTYARSAKFPSCP
jgi:hypothetical protein